ncbi:MAG: DUF72 domain-containing protein [Gemmatimonadetes bacterium]|nr:DUF72 domain-containing protein [Gemmatimonadota bacterium]NIQ56874.1 DUF72 domain-containing protein [Gemmatimonadota bacterium]NIU77053.1 DUF72 domain-containing protein [Gammaproteobacteria bacterium]NIX46396.1 DUF72 domain-containing protein [Gemmatimonadota bacterium]NIY10704.1 DUF72 domain-containing protein [Gemmatimonadota bacterium]
MRIGTQGWSYDHWVGPFYPPGVRSGDWLALYARAFDVVEVDSTFYATPPVERFESWRDRTPEGFMFTLKMPGEVTHEARLRDPRPALRFCEGARVLGSKLGPILVQLPPDYGPRGLEVVADFLGALPEDLAFAIEFRDHRWFVPETLALLRERGTALALSVGPWLDEDTARTLAGDAPGRLLYVRWMGTPRHRRDLAALMTERDGELRSWAHRLDGLDVDEVYAFFNNDYQGHSPASARRLQSLLGQVPVAPAELSPQTELFG